jgi:hypothetical protein
MALNPFFLQGSPGEQRLVQDLINEQLKIYGVEVTYIPRRFVRKETIIKEVTSSKFDDNFLLEAYISNYEGYMGSGDILTKFGMSLRDELTLIISRERFEDFITPFLTDNDEGDLVIFTRPKEGDLIYFPLGKRLFEVKFVEHEQPFYQLGKTYVYELKCELFEYEDEVIETTDEEIDTLVQDQGYITTLNLVGVGSTARASTIVNTGYVSQFYLNNDGSGYTATPNIIFSNSPVAGGTAKAVAITTSIGGVNSIKGVEFINAGYGYTVPPTVTISGGNGTGAAATCSINTSSYGVIAINMISGGVGYSTVPTVTIQGPAIGSTAIGKAVVNSNSTGISTIRIINPGFGYTSGSSPTITIANPLTITGFGTYRYNEIITGSRSGTRARVKSWDQDTLTLKVSFVGIDTNTLGFFNGENIIGSSSSAIYSVKSYNDFDIYDKYSQNKEFQVEGESILDFSESNPFGKY